MFLDKLKFKSSLPILFSPAGFGGIEATLETFSPGWHPLVNGGGLVSPGALGAGLAETFVSGSGFVSFDASIVTKEG